MARFPVFVLLAGLAAAPAAAQPAPAIPPDVAPEVPPEGPPPPPSLSPQRGQGGPLDAPAPPPPPVRAQGGLLDAFEAPDPPPAEDSPTGSPPPADASAGPAGCPREALAALFRTAVDTDDLITALALERETLALCLDRARLEAELRQAERKLAEAAAPPAPEAPPPAAESVVADLVAQLGAAAHASPPEGGPEPPPPSSGEEDPEPPPPPPLRWFSIIGSAGALRAGVSDGTDVWFVSEGDVLPGEAKVARIRARPPGVRLADGRELPWLGDPPPGAPAPAASDGETRR